jgi:hypothetical protein
MTLSLNSPTQRCCLAHRITPSRVLEPPWCVVEAFWSHERLGLSGDTVPIPLVIADLLASLDSRNIEAAQELRESWIRGVEA